MLLAALDATPALLLGMDWMDPDWLLAKFGATLIWVSLAIIFVECGLLFPFLPGDTLLFALGLFIATGRIEFFAAPAAIELSLIMAMLVVAGFLGNVSGYEIGRGLAVPLQHHDGRIIKQKHLRQTEVFFDRYGSIALVLGRFVPFVRTYVTVVAGITRMPRRRFLLWSAIGAVVWIGLITLLGYFLGATVPWLGDNIDLAVIAILVFSVTPIAVGWWRQRRRLP